MFDKLVKMKNRKGFTLVEMLVVIAVIAILASLVVPIFGHSTQKARAATNAANLRSIEGQISTYKVENQQLFEVAVKNLGEQLDPLSYTAAVIAAAIDGYSNVNEYLASGNAFANYVRYKALHITATDEGVITISAGSGYEDIVITGVPAALGVEVDGMYVEEGTPMTVYIADNAVVATYETGDNAFTKDDFAEVAETGKYTGTGGSGGMSEDKVTNDLVQAVACAFGDHIDDGTHVCPACNRNWRDCADNDYDWYCDYGCGEYIHDACRDGDNNLECDSAECNLGVHSQNSGACIDGFLGTADGICDVPGCNEEVEHEGPHELASDKTSCTHTGCRYKYVLDCDNYRNCGGLFGRNFKNGVCTTCGHPQSEHDSSTMPDCGHKAWIKQS